MSDHVILPNGLTLPRTSKKSGNTFTPWLGVNPPFFNKNLLEIVEVDKNISESNTLALDALNNGASSLWFNLKDHRDIPKLLENIRLDIAPVHISGNLHPEDILKAFKSLPKSQNQHLWHGSINIDPFKNAISNGRWFSGSAHEDISRFNLKIPQNVRSICSNANCIPNNNVIDQVAFTISSLIIQLDILGWNNSDRCLVFLKSQSNYLETIAMTQAIRILWRSILEKNNRLDSSLWICGETSLQTHEDPAQQLISRGIEAQSLWLGGCNEIVIHPVDSSSKAKQWARDQFLILAYETGLTREKDILKGSYLIDEWSEKIILASKEKINKWVNNHSFIKEIENETLWE